MITLEEMGKRAVAAKYCLQSLSGSEKEQALQAVAAALRGHTETILAANAKDMQAAQNADMAPSLQDRLLLNNERIEAMASGVEQVAALDDPIGEVTSMKTRPNGLQIAACRVPLGVVGIIYEARPNVTVDAFALTCKTGNAALLKGGSDALYSNMALVQIIRDGLVNTSVPEDAVQLITDTSRETTQAFMQLHAYVDVLIPRGGAGLIQAVKENSRIPVIETGTGNCHIYVDDSADLDMAVSIVENAKTQRLGVCNACESLVVHQAVLAPFLAKLVPCLNVHQIELRCDSRALPYAPDGIPATEEDWGTEYLDRILSVKTVSSLTEAIQHINQYNTRHSESIVTSNYDHARQFLQQIDAACVYVNASTRFTDGQEFGFGAEIGISTQKLHARGPMGLEALTTTKYQIFGSGQIRESR